MASMNQVHPGIWLGNVNAARDLQALLNAGVTHVLNCAAQQCPAFYPQHFQYRSMKLTDTPSQNIMKHFGETSAFIREARRRGGSVFLHCVEGKSRSATCAIAFMIDTEGMTLQDALSRVQGARPIVRPNEGFLIQLGHYEKIVRPGHVGNGGGGSVQLSKAQAGFRISVASPQPVQPPYPKAAQEHQNSAPQQGRRFHAGHAHPHQHTAQWTGHDRGMPSKASAPPQAQRPVNFGPHAYGVLPAPAQAADPQYAHQQQRMAVAYMSGGIPSPTYSAGNDDKWAQRDEKPWTPRGEANVVASAHNGAGWPGPGMEEHAPARGEALSAYSSYSGQQAPPRPRAMGYRSASASGSLPEADPSQHHQHLRHLGVNEVTDQASLHAAVQNQSLFNASHRANAQRQQFEQFMQQADEDEEEEVDWSQLAKDNVFRHLMNSVDDGDAQQAGDVKKFVAGRAIVGKELTC